MLTLEVRGQTKHQLQVDENTNIYRIKETISQLENVPATEILLYSCGAPLLDYLVVSQLPTLTLDITVPLLGGKVHGSLARAGKVKGQTPKVEKQDKKKRKLEEPRGGCSIIEDS